MNEQRQLAPDSRPGQLGGALATALSKQPGPGSLSQLHGLGQKENGVLGGAPQSHLRAGVLVGLCRGCWGSQQCGTLFLGTWRTAPGGTPEDWDFTKQVRSGGSVSLPEASLLYRVFSWAPPTSSSRVI